MLSSVKALAFILLWTIWSPVHSAEQQPLKIGVAKVDITPLDLTGITGIPRREFQGVKEHIYARALVIDNGISVAAIVGVDMVHYGNSLSLRNRIEAELNIPAANIMIAPTHDHSAPRGGPPTPGTAAVTQRRPYSTPAYIQQVEDNIVDSLAQALSAMQPARVGLGSGQVDINAYRYAYYQDEGRWRVGVNPDGPSDKTVWVIKFEDLSGKPIAVMMNYSVHSNIWTGTTQAENRDLIYGDIAGRAQTYVENHFNDEVIAIFTMGAAGDQYAKFNKEMDNAWDDTPAEELVDIQGRMLGMEVLQTAHRIPELSAVASVQVEQRAVPCEMVAYSPGPRDVPHEQVQPGDTLDIQLGLIRINETAITSVSGEIATDIYLRLRKESPLTETIMATLVNDRAGYIPDDANFERMGSAFIRGCAEDAIVTNLVDMINKTMH